MNTNMNELKLLLEHFTARNIEDVKAINLLSEEQVVKQGKNVLDNIIKFVSKRMGELDYELINKTQGDILTLEGYDTLKGSIIALQNMKRRYNLTNPDIDQVEMALDNIVALRENFKIGFKVNNLDIILLYNNLVVAIICTVSHLIATNIEYMKSLEGTYALAMKKAKNGPQTSLFIKNIYSFNKKYASGNIQRFISQNLDKKALAGSTAIMAGIGIISSGLLIISLIREIVYQYYNSRVVISDYLRLQRDFIELNNNSILANQDVAKKQQKIAERLTKLADKIDVDFKVSSKKATTELIGENKELKLSNNSLSMDDMLL